MGYKEGDHGFKSGPIYTDFRHRGAECTHSIPKIVEKGRKCSTPIKAPGAQTRKCSTQVPSNSQGLGYKEGDQDSKSGPIYTNFRRYCARYTRAIHMVKRKEKNYIVLVRALVAQSRTHVT